MSEELNEVRSALLKVADRLSALQRGGVPQDGAQASTTVSASISTRASSTSSSSVPNSAVVEQRRLFGYASKKQYTNKNGKGKGKGKNESTCTLKFVCLASKTASSPPSSIKDRTHLSNMGLGDGSITFGAHEHVYQNILLKYPALSMAGGFELYLFQRGGGEDGGFHVINPPHISTRIKQLAGQAKIYIRPLQRDIEQHQTLQTESQLDQTEESEAAIPVVDCFVCGKAIRMNEMSAHQETHEFPAINTPPEKKQKTLDSIAVPTNKRIIPQSGIEPAPVPSTSGLQDTIMIKEICPDATDIEIQGALDDSNGNTNEAVGRLLGIYSMPSTCITIDDDSVGDNHASESDSELMKPAFENHSTDESPETALQLLQSHVIENAPSKQIITVCRVDGVTELRKEIMGIYKNPRTNLKLMPRIRFEEEEGVGSGPIREFFTETMRALDEGIPSSSGKPLMFIEGESEHRVPTHDHSLRLTGAYKAMGRMIGHSILHGGPGLHGISPGIKFYLSNDKNSDTPPPLTVEDIPDWELRQVISELDSLPFNEKLTPDQRSTLEPYIMEAGLDPDELSCENRKLVMDGLMTYHVIEKRHLELDDIIKGMEEVKLHTFMKRYPNLVRVVFPTDAEQVLSGKEIKAAFEFEETPKEEQERTVGFFKSYIDEIEGAEGGLKLRTLMSFWTGETAFKLSSGKLLIKFDNGENNLPLSETCFRSIILPIKHKEYLEFQKNMDVALKYGAAGFAFH